MKPRTILILAGVFVVLAGLAFLFQTLNNKQMAGPTDPVFPAFAADKADGIDVNGKDKPAKLRKENGRWVVATEGWHDADPKLVKQILEAVPKFTAADLISSSPTKQSTFGVDDKASSIQILQGGKPAASFLVGQPGPDYNSTYIRPTGQNKVYLVPGYLPTMVDRGGETWRNMTLLDTDTNAITGYTTKNAKETVTLEKSADGKWTMKEPDTGDEWRYRHHDRERAGGDSRKSAAGSAREVSCGTRALACAVRTTNHPP